METIDAPVGIDQTEDLDDLPVLTQLRAQLSAFRCLTRNAPVAPALISLVGGSAKLDQVDRNAASGLPRRLDLQPRPSDSPSSAVTSITGVQASQRKRAQARVHARIQELELLLPTLPQSVKFHALLELKQLKLLGLQKRLRDELLQEKWLDEDCQPTALLDWSRWRRCLPDVPVPDPPLYVPSRPRVSLPPLQLPAADVARLQAEDEKRRREVADQRLCEDKRRAASAAIDEFNRRKREEDERTRRDVEGRQAAVASRRKFLGEVLDHGLELRKAWVQQATEHRTQPCTGVRSWHAKQHVRMGEEATERVLALKANNHDEYLRLACSVKEERLLTLMTRTDDVMQRLGAAGHGSRDSSRAVTSPTVQRSQLPASQEPAGATAVGGTHHEPRGVSGSVPGCGDHADWLMELQQEYHGRIHQIKEEVRVPSLLVHGSLRPYQLDGVRFLVSLFNNRVHGILADEMGLGKTIQTIAFLAYLHEFKGVPGPHLILAPKAALSHWINEFAKWTPALDVVMYDGTPDECRQLRQDKVETGQFNVLLTHYDMAMRDKVMLRKVTWEVLIVDEGHRLKDAEPKLLDMLSGFLFKQRILLTGTPVQDTLMELWALLNFLLPKVFNCPDSFDDWFAAPFKGAREDVCGILNEGEQLLVVNRLHQVIRPFIIRRNKTEVAKELPAKVEYIVKCDVSAWQKTLYRRIVDEGKAMSGGANGKVRSLSALSLQLRKACTHPFLMLGDSGTTHVAKADPQDVVRASGKWALLDEVLPKLQRTGHRVLLWSQMTKALDLVEDLLQLRGFKYQRLNGPAQSDDRAELLAAWNAPGSELFVVLPTTQAGALDLNDLPSADTIIMLDSDWHTPMDQQVGRGMGSLLLTNA